VPLGVVHGCAACADRLRRSPSALAEAGGCTRGRVGCAETLCRVWEPGMVLSGWCCRRAAGSGIHDASRLAAALAPRPQGDNPELARPAGWAVLAPPQGAARYSAAVGRAGPARVRCTCSTGLAAGGLTNVAHLSCKQCNSLGCAGPFCREQPRLVMWAGGDRFCVCEGLCDLDSRYSALCIARAQVRTVRQQILLKGWTRSMLSHPYVNTAGTFTRLPRVRALQGHGRAPRHAGPRGRPGRLV